MDNNKKERKITINLDDETCIGLSHLCGKYGMTVGKVIENFVNGLINTAANDLERELLFLWFGHFGSESQKKLLCHLSENAWLGKDPEDYLYLIDDLEQLEKDKEYFALHPEEAGEEVQYIDTDIEDDERQLREMQRDWNPSYEPDMEQENSLIRKWVVEREALLDKDE